MILHYRTDLRDPTPRTGGRGVRTLTQETRHLRTAVFTTIRTLYFFRSNMKEIYALYIQTETFLCFVIFKGIF